ncbi:MAG: DUF58 domain-containing protein [Campylobacterota bacterium]|nr:DUF58 domain-containing protein [Campylobacterota bacterium]
MSFLHTFVQTRKRVRQRATRYSLLVVILLFGLFLEAYMHNFNLVYITLFFVFAAAFSAGPFGLLNIGQLEAGFDHAERLYAREEGRCFFRISNPANTPAWAIELHCDDQKTNIARIDAHSVVNASLLITPEKRGRLQYDSCALQSLFPLSTVRFVLSLKQCCDTIVYPQPKGEPLRSFLLHQRVPFGEEKDFDGLSSYSGAESMSRIHWPSVAKGEPAVKIFEQEMQTLRLEFDFYRSGKSDEARLSQLCLWVLECERSRQLFNIKMPNKILKSDKVSIDAILEYLALY